MSQKRHKKAYDNVQEMKRLVKYLDENISPNLPTFAVQSVCSRVSLLAIQTEQMSIDQDYVDTFIATKTFSWSEREKYNIHQEEK